VRRRALLVAGAVTAALCCAPTAALAHAELEGTTPARDATVHTQPPVVSFRFNESVEGNFGAVRVFDSHGDRVDSGDAFHPNGTGSLMGVHLKPHLPAGTYTATYRVVSADGHIVSSGFNFSIGHPGAAGKAVSSLIGGSGVGTSTELAFGVARGLQYAAIAVGVGAMLFLLLVWLPALSLVGGGGEEWQAASSAFVARLRRLVIGASIVGLVSSTAGVVLEAASAAGISGWSALTPKIVGEELHTHFGTMWGLAVLAWAMSGLLAAVILSPRRERAPVLRPAELGATGLALRSPASNVRLGLLCAPLAFLLLVPAFAGHADTQHPTWLLFPTNVLHVLGMSAWLGGLVAILLALPAATRLLERSDRTRLLAGSLGRFSDLALVSVAVIMASGLIQAYVYVRTPAHLIDTAFGRCVLIKFCLLLVLIGFGAFNRRRSVPELSRLAREGQSPGQPGLLLRRALRAEVAVIAVVLGVTAALSSYAPSIQAATGPVNVTRMLGPAELEMTVDPARVGANDIHLYLLNPKDGSQFTGAKEVDLAETMPSKGIGPIQQVAQLAGPGHYIVPAALLNVPGEWKLALTVRTSEFDQFTTTVPVHVH
jgi:copper transport protein